MAATEGSAQVGRRILLVGGGGFLGGALHATLTAQHEVYATCRGAHAASKAIRFDVFKDKFTPLLEHTRAEIVVLSWRLGSDASDSTPSLERIEPVLGEVATSLAGRRVVLISTDAVFDGSKGLYREEDIPAPATDHGRRSRLCEEILGAGDIDLLIVRLSYLFGYSQGRLDGRLANTRDALLRGDSPSFFDNVYKSPLEVNAAARIVAAVAVGTVGKIIHVGGPRMSVYHFQRDAMRALGLPYERIQPARAPVDSMTPRDTSLDTSLATQLTGFKPVSIEQSLSTGAP